MLSAGLSSRSSKLTKKIRKLQILSSRSLINHVYFKRMKDYRCAKKSPFWNKTVSERRKWRLFNTGLTQPQELEKSFQFKLSIQNSRRTSRNVFRLLWTIWSSYFYRMKRTSRDFQRLKNFITRNCSSQSRKRYGLTDRSLKSWLTRKCTFCFTSENVSKWGWLNIFQKKAFPHTFFQ